MTEAELDKLADKISEKMAHEYCPLGLNKDAADAAMMWGRAQHNVQAEDGAYVVLLRIGKESDNIVVRVVRLLLLGALIASVAILGKIGIEHLARLLR